MAIIAFPRLIFPIAAGSEAAAIAAANLAENPDSIEDIGGGAYNLILTCHQDGNYSPPNYFESDVVLGFGARFATTTLVPTRFGIDAYCSRAAIDILQSLNVSAEGFICRNENEANYIDNYRESRVKLAGTPAPSNIVINIQGYGYRSLNTWRIEFLEIG